MRGGRVEGARDPAGREGRAAKTDRGGQGGEIARSERGQGRDD